MNIEHIVFEPEFSFKTSRSGGKGGQHVNKVSSKVVLEFDVKNSFLLDEIQKQVVFSRLGNRINSEGVLQLTVQSDRSQLKNKETAIKKFYQLLQECFKPRKARKPTKISKSIKEKRFKSKKIQSEKKERRRIDY